MMKFVVLMRIIKAQVIILALSWSTSAISLPQDDDSRFLISCHTTDFECFKVQYQYVRDYFLLGNERYGIRKYKPHTFRDEATETCAQISGLESSQLIGIKMDSITKEFTMVIVLPFHIQQINHPTFCTQRDEVELKSFDGNATIHITYPYRLTTKDDGIHLMHLGDENMDVVLDILDLSQQRGGPASMRKMYDASEWAFKVMQHVDAVEYFALPFTTQLRQLMNKVPLHKLIELYPEQNYKNLSFKFPDNVYACCDRDL